jgi:hypothetical protein
MRAFEVAGREFIDENGGGPGVRLRKLPRGNHESERANYGCPRLDSPFSIALF